MLDSEYVKGAEKLGRRIATVRAALALPPLTQEIGKLLLKRTRNRFDKEIDPSGNQWRALAPATLEIKKRLGYGDKGKLKRTESLRNSIRLIRGGAGTLYTNTGASVRIGIEDPVEAAIGRIQNYGEGKIPARRFLGIGELDVKAVDSLLRRKAKSVEDL